MYLSILVSVYNEQYSIKRCLDSILKQTFGDFEVIVVDDGSCDRSGEICDRYRLKDSRIKVIHKTNQGLAAARKTALNACCGEYVGFVDSDDYIDEHMFEKLCGAARDNDADMVVCGAVHHIGERTECHQGAKSFGVFDKKRMENEIYRDMLSSNGFFEFGVTPPLWNKIFRRNIIQCYFNVDNGTVMGEDVAAVYPSLLRSKKVVILKDEFLYHYVVSKRSMTMSYKKWFFGSNRCVYRTLKGVKASEGFGEQIEDYILYTSAAALKNEFSKENSRTFLEKLSGMIMYLTSDDVNKAFCNAENRRLPLYIKIIGRLTKRKKYMQLALFIKLLNFAVEMRRGR